MCVCGWRAAPSRPPPRTSSVARRSQTTTAFSSPATARWRPSAENATHCTSPSCRSRSRCTLRSTSTIWTRLSADRSIDRSIDRRYVSTHNPSPPMLIPEHHNITIWRGVWREIKINRQTPNIRLIHTTHVFWGVRDKARAAAHLHEVVDRANREPRAVRRECDRVDKRIEFERAGQLDPAAGAVDQRGRAVRRGARPRRRGRGGPSGERRAAGGRVVEHRVVRELRRAIHTYMNTRQSCLFTAHPLGTRRRPQGDRRA